MNTYKITFSRENGSTGTDHFTAANERQARKDFGECYRHSTATIISIELASTNAPATKQQERDTLEKIRKMITGFGQLTGHVTDLNAQRLGTDYFEVTWHAGYKPGLRRSTVGDGQGREHRPAGAGRVQRPDDDQGSR